METIILTCGADDVDEIDRHLSENGVAAQRSPRRQLDGAAATTWVLVAGVAVQSAPAILTSLRDLLTRNRVRELKIGDVTIVNPSPADVDKLLEERREPRQ
ncbi:hypothetical protein [Nocardia aurea]|uniref:hypothetical protein n=1 Tax=Nocardia aurea TaxID=2144174 RepID=UPI000D685D3E|nr:hypothetical protein [Nocardia aurea]